MNCLCIYTNTCFDKTPVNLGPDGVPNDSWAPGASSSTWVSSSLPRNKNDYLKNMKREGVKRKKSALKTSADNITKKNSPKI